MAQTKVSLFMARLLGILYYIFLAPIIFLLSPLLMLFMTFNIKLSLNLGGMLAFAGTGVKHYFTIRKAYKLLEQEHRKKAYINFLIKAQGAAENVANAINQWGFEAKDIATKSESADEKGKAVVSDGIEGSKKDGEQGNTQEKTAECKETLITPDNFKAVMQVGPQNVQIFTEALTLMYKGSPRLMTEMTRKTLIVAGKEALLIAEQLVKLFKVSSELITQKACTALLKALDVDANDADVIKLHDYYLTQSRKTPSIWYPTSQVACIGIVKQRRCRKVTDNLMKLYQAYLELKFLTEEPYKTFINAAGDNAGYVAEAMINLYKSSPTLLTVEHCQTLVTAGFNQHPALVASGPELVAAGLIKLSEYPELLTAENRQILLDAAADPEVGVTGMANALVILYKADKTILSAKNRKILLDAAAKISVYNGLLDFAEGLVFLHKANPDFITEENCQLLIAAVAGYGAQELGEILAIFHSAGGALLTEKNKRILLDFSRKSMRLFNIASGLRRLNDASPALVTQENFDLIVRVVTAPNGDGDAGWAAYGIALLHSAENPELITRENWAKLEVHAGNLSFGYETNILYLFFNIGKAKELITQANFDTLLALKESAIRYVRDALYILAGKNIGLVNQESLNNLIRAGETAEETAKEVAAEMIRQDTTPKEEVKIYCGDFDRFFGFLRLRHKIPAAVAAAPADEQQTAEDEPAQRNLRAPGI